MKVTILTPSYNRSYTLKKLYNSLLNQTSKNFEWLVVDDGSSDDTEELLTNFINEKKITIHYIKKENGGKHTAINLGVQKITTEMTFIVDSDDFLTNDSIENICYYYEKYKHDQTICGFSFLRGNLSNDIIGDKYYKDEFISNYIEYRINKKVLGDKAEVYYTDILKKYPFPVYKGEKFLSEDVVWIEIAKKYDTLYINKVIYNCEYLGDGLTANDKKIKFSSPLGSVHRGKQMMYKKINLLTRIKGAIIYNCYKYDLNNEIPDNLKLQNITDKLLVKLTKALGKFYNKKWKHMC